MNAPIKHDSSFRYLRLLLVEDSEDDALLLLRELRQGGFQPDHHRVQSIAMLRRALSESPGWDIVITDHNLPGFDSGTSLKVIQETAPDTPVIIVSGNIGEEAAVEAMRNGARDYILKENLSRLAPAVARELRENSVRRQHRQAQATIAHLAVHDALTNLVNRREFDSRLKLALQNTLPAQAGALIYIDLDQFKVVNDTCGHEAGDDLLRQLSRLLQGPVRDCDTLARLGGDEFGVLVQDCTPEQAEAVAWRMLNLINEFRYVWEDKIFRVGASIGLVLLDDPHATPSEVMRKADMACYAAKDQGRNRIHMFRDDDLALRNSHTQMQWVSRINDCLENDGLLLRCQEIRPLAADGPGHYEILIRMKEDDGGLITPGAFIPAAERYNLMPDIDRRVISSALAMIRSKINRDAIIRGSRWFINLSGLTVGQEHFHDFVTRQLEHHGIPPGMIGFEITETAVIGNLATAIRFIQAVRNMGCHVALDDFGTGLSSFAYLKSIPADYLKIDGGFVRDMLENSMHHAIVDAINRVGHVAGLKTVAEFVESEVIRLELETLGVDYGQGYGISSPGPMTG
jgi:diguanylate cyclase (GGDEF)-like protein